MHDQDIYRNILSNILRQAKELVDEGLDLAAEDPPAGDSIAEQVAAVKQLEALKEIAESIDKALGGQIDFFKKVSLPELLIEKDLKSCKVETSQGDFQVVLMPDMYINVPADNKDSLKQWFRDNGNEDIITETINAATLKAFVKGAFEDGLAWPEELLKVSPYSKVRITKK